MATKPSLALIPSAYKASKVYSVLPSDGTGDFDFSRSGNATRVNKDGLIELVGNNEPRLNYPMIDGVVSGCPSLLLEPQRTNLITYSEAFDNAYWTKATSDSTPIPLVTANYAISPDGTQNADRVQLTLPTNNEFAVVRRSGINPNTPVGSTIYQSIYLKATDISQIGKKVDVYIYDTTNSSYRRIFNHVLTNNWERIESNNLISFGSTSTSVEYVLGKARANAIGQSSTTGTTQSEAASDFLVWGAQLEQGSYATSYIPTQGSSVTRVTETCSQTTPSGIIGQTEGTVFLDFNINNLENQTNDPIILSFNSSNFIQIFDNGRVNYYDGVGNIDINLPSYGLTNGRHKFGIAYNINDAAFYIDGTLVGTDTNCSPSAKSSLYLGYTNVNFLPVISYNEVKLYNTRLSNSELAALTS